MRETGVSKLHRFDLQGKGQYSLAFLAIAGTLYFVGFPLFLLFFFGLLTFFIWKSFSLETRGETNCIFDFYLSASEMLRDDHRRWFGFEIAGAIAKGEAIVSDMGAPPPLVYFTLGALYQRAGDHAAAAKYLGAVAGASSSDESSIVTPSEELLEYTRILRKIERNPVDAPLISAAMRHLERTRKNKAEEMYKFSIEQPESGPNELTAGSRIEEKAAEEASASHAYNFAEFAKNRRGRMDGEGSEERRTISELLHDIYDEREG